uniref:NADH-ubiquinone oxidoreductase chain 6 n=1 Tax=Lethocerus indicus TaxID=212017 RepID=A0A0N7AG68_LETIN|nr:NADH dehydrogenase subunit 6 [Lethocerus indicus]AJG02895.1 NADH dehydrogenase subunit 6 [Lethocerus indicus]
MMMTAMAMMAMMMTTMKHPLSMGGILMIQTMLVSLMTGMMINSFMFSYMLMLIMLGGMLVLFMYMSSVASNEKFKSSIKMTMIVITTMTISMATMMMSDKMMTSMEMPTQMMMMENDQTLTVIKLFNGQTMAITIMMILYLLVTMIVVSFIANIQEGPMRKKS